MFRSLRLGMLRNTGSRRSAAPRTPRARLTLEALEGRVLLTLGNPVWVSQGPAPISGGTLTTLTSGAVDAIAADPTNADRVFVSTTDGGVWRTTNATAQFPIWTPLTDQMPFLGTSDIAFSPVDPANNTLFVATGRVASSFKQGGPAVGIYRTTNAADPTVNWTQLGAATFTGLTIASIVPTRIVLPGAGANLDREVILAGVATSPAGGNGFTPPTAGPTGLYRSADGGQTWTLISGTGNLPAGDVTQIVADNFNPNQPRFYAGVVGQGIFVSLDGVNWNPVAGNAQIAGIADTSRIRLAVHNSPGNDVLYAETINGASMMTGVFRSADQGANWAAMGLPTPGNITGTQGGLHASIVADPTDPTAVDVGGSTTQAPPFVGVHFRGALDNVPRSISLITVTNPGAGYTTPPTVTFTGGGGTTTATATLDAQGRVTGVVITGGGNGYTSAPTITFTGGNPTIPAAATATIPIWTSLDGPGANNTTIHADSRTMVFAANGTLLEGDDGGIFRLSTPSNPATRTWTSAVNNLSVNEDEFVAYDSVNHTVFGGSQDNGTPTQNGENTTILYSDQSSGDGQRSAVDNTSVPGSSIHYTSNQASYLTNTFNGSNVPQQPFATPLAQAVNGAGLNADGTPMNLRSFDRTANGRFDIPFVLNAVDPTRMLVGTNFLYQSNDRGNTLTPVAGVANGAPVGDIGSVSALAYGGFINGTPLRDIAYAGTNGLSANGPTNRLYFRFGDTGAAAFTPVATYPGSTPLAIVPDPSDVRVLYVLDNNSQVWRCANAAVAGVPFVNITGNLPTLLYNLKTMTIFQPGPGAQPVLFVGGQSGVAGTDAPATGGPAVWTRFGTGLPNVMVTSLAFDTTDNVLAASTFGRGFWKASVVSNFAGWQAPVLAPAADRSTFTAGGPAVPGSSLALTVTAGSSPMLTRAVVTITNPLDAPNEVLAVNTTAFPTFTAVYNAAAGQLVVTPRAGADTAANFQNILRGLAYQDAAPAPNQTPRVITVQVSDGFVTSNRATMTVTIAGAAPNAPAVATNQAVPPTFTANGAPVPVLPQATIQGPGSGTLSSATVTITDPKDAGQEVLAVDTAGTGITANYDPATDVLTLTGTASVAQYQQVLDSLTYDDTDPGVPNPTPREIDVDVSDGTDASLTDAVLVTVAPVNHAPVINGNPTFRLDPTNVADDPGTLVADLLESGRPRGAITDPDPGAALGIAVVGVDNTHGTWQFSVDGGQTWQDFDAPSPAHATLLTDDVEALVRFVPDAGFAGDVPGGLQFRAWDQTGGLPQVTPNDDTDGAIADTTVNGGHTAFSTAIASADANVLPDNFSFDPDAQTLTLTGSAGGNNAFAFAQATTADPFGTSTTYFLDLNGTVKAFTSDQVSNIVVSAPGGGNSALFLTGDTYVDANGATQETAEIITLGNGGGRLERVQADGTRTPLLQVNGFTQVAAYAGHADQAVINGTAGVVNAFETSGLSSYMASGAAIYFVAGAAGVDGVAAGAADYAVHNDGSGPSTFLVSGIAYAYMVGTDQGQSFFNESEGFRFTTGVARNAGQDLAIFYDSPLDDTFVGMTSTSTMTATNADGSLAEDDVANGFASVDAYSFVGGNDTASIYDTNVNHVVGFRRVV